MMPGRGTHIAFALVIAFAVGCEPAPATIRSASPSVSLAPPRTPSNAAKQTTLTRLNQLAADEGANAMIFDTSSDATYVVTYSGADSISRISPDGEQVLARHLLPNRPEFGSIIREVAVAGSTMVVNRSLLETLALVDIASGKTIRQVSAQDFGVAHLGPVVAGAPGHAFVIATLPLPMTAPFIADTIVLELDASGSVVRRASVPPATIGAYPANATGVVFDASLGSLFFGSLSDVAGVGRILVLERGATAARAFAYPPDGARLLAGDGPRRTLYVGSGPSAAGTRVDLYDNSTGMLVRTATTDLTLGMCVIDESMNVLLATAPFRDHEADLLLVLDASTLKVLAQAEVPWDPYGHGIAVDPTRSRVYVSSRVRPASVATFGLAVVR